MSESIKYQGCLEKQGRLKTWSWKKYWFVLQDEQLTYFREEKRSSSQGLINMSQALSVRPAKSGSRGFPFEIVTKTRTHVLMAPTAELREKWIKYLQQAIGLQDRKSLSRVLSMSTPSCNSISDDEEVVYASIDGDEVFYEEIKTSTISKSRENSALFSDDNVIVDNDIYERADLENQNSEMDKKLEDKPDGEKEVEPEEELYAKVNKPRPSSSVISKDSLYQDAERQHKDLKRLCEPSPRHAPLLRRTRLAQLETSNSLSSACSDSTEEATDSDNGKTNLRESLSSDSDSTPRAIVPPSCSLDFNCNAVQIPDLPHPRLEIDWNSPFDKIRVFIANNRSPMEFYAAHKPSGNGQALEKLREFLVQLESQLARVQEEGKKGAREKVALPQDDNILEITAL